MSDVLLPLLPTLALAIYLFYVIFCESAKQPGAEGDEASSGGSQSEPAEQETAIVSAKVIQKPVEPAINKIKQSEEKPVKAEVTEDLGLPDHYRNPKTDELAPVPNNYRFAKRWIKAALVEEGLLDKIYRNNELGKKNSEKVKKALLELAQLPQYRG